MDMSLELVGLVGGLLFLFAFIQVALNKACNICAALALGYYSIQKHAYTNIALNLVWGTVALYAILHSIKRHSVRKKKKSP
jgi:hypothetical protein